MNQRRAENILKFIRDYIDQYHISPSVREICEGVGLASTSTIHRYLHQLEQDGKINMTIGQNRSIVISDSKNKKIPLLDPENLDASEENAPKDYITYHPPGRPRELFAIYAPQDFPQMGILKNDILIAEKTQNFEEDKLTLFYDEEHHIAVSDDIPPSAFAMLISVIRNYAKKKE